MRRSVVQAAVPLFTAALVSASYAATSPRAVQSPFNGNGHNVTFDGRLFIVRRTPGWEAAVLRPQSVLSTAGFADVSQAFSPFVLIQGDPFNENALALCEETPQPQACQQSGTIDPNGAFACYELVVIDSDALAAKPANVLRARRLRVVVSQPNTASAAIDSFTWTQPSPITLSQTLRGIEPTVTKDGKLLIWQGVPSNTGDIDTLVYSVNTTACGLGGWSAPKSITAMNSDPLLAGKYKLAEKPLRGADGSTYVPNQLFYGAYPWVFPDGEAINFTATNLPCKTPPPNESPPGCGPRRNALSVIGYPTNWQLSHVDGAVNPDTDETVRLFFSSPGPLNASPLPVLKGKDVWPFFGSNTSNYTELVFDDGLDGQYAGLWHMNELVTKVGTFDLTKTPDSSGYANTGALKGGASFPPKNNGPLGKAIVFDGTSGRVEVPHASSLNPVNAITVELWLKLASDPDCDGNNNYRLVLGKGNIADGAYTVVLEENRDVQVRLRVAGGAQYSLNAATQLPIGVWTHVASQYHAGTGTQVLLVDGQETNRTVHPPATLMGSPDLLTIGGPPGTRAACPNGDGAFHGELDEVAVSRVWRYGTVPGGVDAGTPMEPDAGVEPVDAGMGGPAVPPDAGVHADAGHTIDADSGTTDALDGGGGEPSGPGSRHTDGQTGCGCGTGTGSGGASLLLAMLWAGSAGLLNRRGVRRCRSAARPLPSPGAGSARRP